MSQDVEIARQGSAAGGPAPEDGVMDVTPEMAEAGRSAYYATPRYRGDEPINEEMVALIYRAMRRLEAIARK